MSLFRHHSATEKPLLTTATPSNDLVPFHDLCERCKRFCKQWGVLDWLQEGKDQSVPSWPASYMCSVTQLASSVHVCHFCKFLMASLERRAKMLGVRRFEGMSVYLDVRMKNGMISSVAGILTGKEHVEGEGKQFGSFMIGTYIDPDPQIGAFNGHITTKEVPMRANDSIPKAKQWLQTCLHSHAKCQDFHTSTVLDPHQRPTRVLEITAKGIRLRCDMQNQSFDYLVLSYMWGTNHTQQLRLLQSNLGAFQEEVPRGKFEASDIYKEAVRVTLVLGYRYLWIDSLCIMQDSTSDWDLEARRMAIVYGNSVCNLAFLFPPNTPCKATARDDPRVWNPCILRPATADGLGVYIEHLNPELRGDFQNDEKATDWLVQRNWPLFGRAWTFQEYLLSPRTLLLGGKNMMFQCSQLFYDELLGPIAEPPSSTSLSKQGKDRGKARYFPPSIHSLNKAESFSELDVLSFMLDWQNTLNEYRSRSLSFPKDRIPAFAGIASACSTLAQVTYLAGLWAESLPTCLLWSLDRKPPPLVRRENQLPNGPLPPSLWTSEIVEDVAQTAPTWSPFSVPIYKYHQQSFLFSSDEIYIRAKSLSNPGLVRWHDISCAKLLYYTFLGCPPNHPPASRFFAFGGVEIALEMRVFPVSKDWPADLACQIHRIQSKEREGAFCWDPVLTYYPDDPSRRASPPQNAVYAVVAEFQIVRTAGKYTVQRRLAGLLLIPAAERGTWMRVGAWKLDLKVSGLDVTTENMVAVAQRWRGYSVVSEKWKIETIVLV